MNQAAISDSKEEPRMFTNREEAARELGEALSCIPLKNPIVLAIPRGGVVIGKILADILGADLDVVLARKLRAPHQSESAIGAISENGCVYLNPDSQDILLFHEEHLSKERRFQLEEIARRKELYRTVHPAVELAGRSVIVTDDGIATGSTIMAALKAVHPQRPYEVIVAVPVGCPDRIKQLRHWCDKVVCIQQPEHFEAVGQFYEEFPPIDDDRVIQLLQRHGCRQTQTI
jgi:putative phosphoribosyl transferase